MDRIQTLRFTGGLINDLRLNAPHVRCSVVMPGHVGTAIANNSRRVLAGHGLADMSGEEIAEERRTLERTGVPADTLSDEEVRQIVEERARQFEVGAPTTAAQAARTILDGVRESRWRILVGADAEVLDTLVREMPEQAYDQVFMDRVREAGHWRAF